MMIQNYVQIEGGARCIFTQPGTLYNCQKVTNPKWYCRDVGVFFVEHYKSNGAIYRETKPRARFINSFY
jgi:hypothetical protein